MCDRKTFIQDIENSGTTNFIKQTEIYKTCSKENADKFVIDLIDWIEKGEIKTKHNWTGKMKLLCKKYHSVIGKVALNYSYLNLISENKIKPSKLFRSFTVGHECRSEYGVVSVSVMTSPIPSVINENGIEESQSFSCKYNCAYCPDQPGSVRSYIRGGPTAERGFQNDFLPVAQMDDRLSALFLNGHDIDKLEVLVLGGTWDSYPIQYQEWFITRLYYAANTFFDDKKASRRKIFSLEDEKEINETAMVRIIGLTLETRPDQINSEQILRLHRYGCTRLQLGVQHTDDRILKKVKRDCYLADIIRANTNLRNVGFKLDFHLMPQLPDASQEDDIKMLQRVNEDPDLQADQIKVYPCEVTPWTQIEKWFLDGSYTPYPNEYMINIVIDYKTKIKPWIRINRVGRDALPEHAIAGNPYPNLRQVIHEKMDKLNLKCNCIRCREVGIVPSRVARIKDAVLMVREYEATGGKEFFISIETPDEEIIFGFCRLRLCTKAGYVTDIDPVTKQEVEVNAFPYLNDHAFIRELHIYGKVNRVDDNSGSDVQHRGFGKKLVAKAEEIAISHGFAKMAIISGVGVRQYYRKFGYTLEGAYMTKTFKSITNQSNFFSMTNVDQILNYVMVSVILIYFYLKFLFRYLDSDFFF
jgi:ELP3 family radical SAM enzyme/protein acetyltransferase